MGNFLEAVKAALGGLSCIALPTLTWISSSTVFCSFSAGRCFAFAAIGCGIAPLLLCGILWAFFLSLVNVGDVFLQYQWEGLLLEAGFLALLIAPRGLYPLRKSSTPPPSAIGIWLHRWLLFRLLFASGAVKLLSGDETWRNLSALHFHYMTQPLPTWIAWYAYQLPMIVQQASTLSVLFVELALPFLSSSAADSGELPSRSKSRCKCSFC